jgi:peroxiredoxin
MKKSLGFFLLLLAALAAQAQSPEMVDNLSFADPGFETRQLSAYNGKKAIVIVFTSSNCSWATKYEERLRALRDSFDSQGVQFLAINSNDPTMSELDAVARMRQANPYNFPYVKDEDQHLAKALKVTKNPEVVVLAPRAGRFAVLYRGKIDDNPLDPALVKHNYLQNALKALLAGKSPEAAGTPPSGCNIKWKAE